MGFNSGLKRLMKFGISVFLPKPLYAIQVSLKYDKINVFFT